MTFEQLLRTRLFNSGLSDFQVDAVVERVKGAPENAAMAHRWSDEVDGYSPQMQAVLWLTTKRHALAWIDETCPQAWFRGMFTDEVET